MNLSEKRIFSRFTARFPTKIKDSAEDYGQSVYLRDVSAAGARVVSRERLYIDDTLTLSVNLPDGLEPLDLCGRVRWVHHDSPRVWEAGLQFPKVDFMKMHRIVRHTLEATPV